MSVFNTLPDHAEEFDIIIAGASTSAGGTAGCVVASRLAEAEPHLSILVIESGRDNHNVLSIVTPALWRTNLQPDNHRVLFHKAVKQEQLANRQSVVQVGNTLGGGSSINLMMYMRPQQCDYDSWQLETYHGPGKEEHHGFSGPIHVSRGCLSSEAKRSFLDAMNRVGFEEVEDLQDLTSTGATRLQKDISPDGKRQDVAHAYLYPILQSGKHPYLQILVESQVVGVLFDHNRRACGVQFRSNPIFQPNTDPCLVRNVSAKRLVRSGIGDTSLLERVGTGQADIQTLLASNDNILGWNGIDASSKIRPTSLEVVELLGDCTNVPHGQYFSFCVFTTYPYSRGHLHITGPNMDDPPEFKTGYLTDERGLDIKAQVWAYKKQRQVAQRMSINRGEIKHRHSSFAEDSPASCFTYTAADEAAIEDWIRRNMLTTWHGIGTCKMGLMEDMGVVDETLSVHGVSGLKIADLSVFPQSVCSNTMNTALTIGEKAADIFISELRSSQ
ncbi:alcohol oxidase-like protein [Xylariaceae sp. FL1272]|nr:alcohol oxidase-like protein [Xylariaceae sp. FL1272]